MRLKDVWKDGPQTYLGVLVEGFPNMLMAMGPHAGLGNYTRTAEYSVEYVTGLIRFATERGLNRIEATTEAVAESRPSFGYDRRENPCRYRRGPKANGRPRTAR